MENNDNGMSSDMLIDSNDEINDTLTKNFSQMNVDSQTELESPLTRQHSRTSWNSDVTDSSVNSLTRNNSRSRSALIFDEDDDSKNNNNNNSDGDDPLSKTSSQISEESIMSYEDANQQTLPPLQQQQQQQVDVQQSNVQRQQGAPNNLMVPVDIVWQQGGNKAYVTGSFTGWRKMIGLVPVPGKPGLLHVKLQLPPGTHRFRFIVDNELRFSDYLPTATDQMGNFVNYLEVVAPNQQQQQNSSRPGEERTVSSRDDTTSHGHLGGQNSSNKKKRTMPMSTRSRIAMEIEQEPDDMGDGYSRYYDEVLSKPRLEYTQDIPAVFTDPTVMEQYYLTLDQQQNNHQNMAWLTPPQLPPYLENVILNSYSNSQIENNENNSGALPIPNHVILNHLATSSIKHNTLCVASIVRYKQKYVTQILYAPLQ